MAYRAQLIRLFVAAAPAGRKNCHKEPAYRQACYTEDEWLPICRFEDDLVTLPEGKSTELAHDDEDHYYRSLGVESQESAKVPVIVLDYY